MTVEVDREAELKNFFIMATRIKAAIRNGDDEDLSDCLDMIELIAVMTPSPRLRKRCMRAITRFRGGLRVYTMAS